MIKLSKRLNEIANMIDKDDVVIDVGCDHALLDIFLASKYNKVYYASDLRKSALNKGKENIEKYKMDNNIVLICDNGLNGIKDEYNINTAVITGLGYQTILKILKNKEKLSSINKLVIESNTNPEIIRKYLVKNGYYIDKETLVLDNNFYYFITSYKKGEKKYNHIDLELGIINNHDLFNEYLKIELKKCNILLSVVPKKKIIKRLQIKRRIKLIKKKLNITH